MKDTAYENLPENEHIHWDRYKNVHSEGVVNYVRTILGTKVDKTEFAKNYSELSTAKKRKNKGFMAMKRQRGRKEFEFIKKYGWIK